MLLLHSKRLRNAISWIAFVLIGFQVCFSGFLLPYHNWDEIPYTYLASRDACESELHAAHYEYLEKRIPALLKENSQLRSSADQSYRRRALLDHGYFCSNLPFYTTKKLYIYTVRWLTTVSGDALDAVRLASVLPGLIWYIVLGVAILLRMPGGVLGRLIMFLLLGRIGTELARLSTPDALGCLMIAVSTVVMLLGARHAQDKMHSMWLPSLAAVTAGILGGLSIAARSNLAIVVIIFGSSIVPFAKRSLAFTYLGIAFASFGITSRLLSGLLVGYPDSYSHLTLLMFHSGGMFGPSGDPLAEIRQVSISEVPFGNLLAVFKSSAKSAVAGLMQILSYMLIPFFSSYSFFRLKKNEAAADFLVSNGFCLIAILATFGYLAQASLFPLTEIRMIAPYITAVIAVLCLDVSGHISRITMHLNWVADRGRPAPDL